MISLHVNIDHVATIRQARRGEEPEPVTAAGIAEMSGADGITIHLREDRRHIQDRDVELINQVVQTRLNLEMAATGEMFGIALRIKPDIVTLVPEKREEITTEGGLDVISNRDSLLSIQQLKDEGIRVSLFIDPDPKQIEASTDCGADDVELHTGSYATAFNRKNHEHGSNIFEHEYNRLVQASELAHQCGLQVNAGHGLNYHNTRKICHLPHLYELNIGHSIISRGIFSGLQKAVREMRELIDHEVTSAL